MEDKLSKNAFPLLVLINGEYELVGSPNDIPLNSPFTILAVKATTQMRELAVTCYRRGVTKQQEKGGE